MQKKKTRETRRVILTLRPSTDSIVCTLKAVKQKKLRKHVFLSFDWNYYNLEISVAFFLPASITPPLLRHSPTDYFCMLRTQSGFHERVFGHKKLMKVKLQQLLLLSATCWRKERVDSVYRSEEAEINLQPSHYEEVNDFCASVNTFCVPLHIFPFHRVTDMKMSRSAGLSNFLKNCEFSRNYFQRRIDTYAVLQGAASEWTVSVLTVIKRRFLIVLGRRWRPEARTGSAALSAGWMVLVGFGGGEFTGRQPAAGQAVKDVYVNLLSAREWSCKVVQFPHQQSAGRNTRLCLDNLRTNMEALRMLSAALSDINSVLKGQDHSWGGDESSTSSLRL